MEEEEWTCGKGLAANAALPRTIGRVLAGLANVLDNHMQALVLTSDESRAEYGAYERLVGEHRALASQLAATADAMEGYRNLPDGVHDDAAMAEPAAREAFESLVRAEEELLGLLQQSSTEHRAMLSEWS
ncbi:hypothetical protein [Streptomyces sp. WMMB 322]|uniref:hypothetical protein n=1 Tax=Streptomyces sp. WMMB 322 TaxID=1286821 RepID=UPI0006E337AE|nr:hypothetical protein [Streptomyces sp. WMMB 322]SCK10239.1 hypothetical protein H180DRAFT_00545 [Streptomyces sp. WMMB 322]